jgi:cytoskeletal protein RodZ
MATRLGSDDPLQIGAILAQTRKRLGLELPDVEQRTKIRVKYLRALEDEDWEVLPAPAYTRGFLRAYAAALGLDSELLVDEFRRRHESSTGTLELPEPVLKGRRGFESGKRGIPVGWILVAALIVVVGVLAAIILAGYG